MVLHGLGEAHGYGILSELKDRVGGGWKPSPGAIYPALVALVESGHIGSTEKEGNRVYFLTDQGRAVAASSNSNSRWRALSERAVEGADRISIGALLDRFAAESPIRRRLTAVEQRQAIESILERAAEAIEQTMAEGENYG